MDKKAKRMMRSEKARKKRRTVKEIIFACTVRKFSRLRKLRRRS